jgi:hypothetical protein
MSFLTAASFLFWTPGPFHVAISIRLSYKPRTESAAGLTSVGCVILQAYGLTMEIKMAVMCTNNKRQRKPEQQARGRPFPGRVATAASLSDLKNVVVRRVK